MDHDDNHFFQSRRRLLLHFDSNEEIALGSLSRTKISRALLRRLAHSRHGIPNSDQYARQRQLTSAMLSAFSFARPVGGNRGVPFGGASLAQPMGEATAIGKAWQTKDLSHGDLLLVACPFDRC
jgi:hypothetical protein